MPWVGKCWLAERHRGVLVCRIQLHWLVGIRHDFVDVGHLQLLEHSAHDSLGVNHPGELFAQRQHGLQLGNTLGFAEDVRIRNGDDVAVLAEVLALDWQLCDHVALAHIVEIPPIDAPKHAQHAALAFVQSSVD